jgi:NADPH:quinone reductase-like Zn-dependent oxidoreductase
MKAMVRHAYGPPDLLQLEEVKTPSPGDGELLVRVRAASLNLGDWELMTARPLYITVLAQLFGGRPRVRPGAPSDDRRSFLQRLFQPKFKILGCDFSGRVEAIGGGVTRFAPGDDVLGLCVFGAFAEYVCLPQDAPLARKPAGVSHEVAAALPQAAFLAVQAIRDRGKVGAGQRVLIVGAGGGAGTLAVQLAKLRGAEVTGVDRSSKAEMLRSIGADRVIDYTREEFTASGERYDLIFDLVARRSVFACLRSLTPEGIYLAAGGSLGSFCQTLFLGPLISKLGRKRVAFLMAHSDPENLRHVLELIEVGRLAPTIERCYPLSELPEALRRVGDGQALGKLVVTI